VSTFCGNCGTEVEDDALFCPACGQAMTVAAAAAPELPPAPDWPDPSRSSEPAPEGADSAAAEHAAGGEHDERLAEAADDATPAVDTAPRPRDAPEVPGPSAPAALGRQPQASAGTDDPIGPGEQGEVASPDRAGRMLGDASPDSVSTAAPAVPPWRRGAALRSPSAGAGDAETARPDDDRPGHAPTVPPAATVRRPQPVPAAPTTLSGWLVGGGAVVGIVSLFLPWLQGGGTYLDRWGMAYGINILVLVALLAIATIEFAADAVPSFPRRNLAVLAAALIGIGIGLDRATQSFAGLGAPIFLVAMIAAAVGALLVELDRDRPIGGTPGGPTGGPQA
jgi:zinc-ribbon domain